ncbi:MAG: glucose-6-phosphate isomerase [Gammaproteobacteria bacterium]
MTKFDDLWAELIDRGAERLTERIDALFAAEPNRTSELCLSAPGLFADLSKNLLDAGDVRKLEELAKAAQVSEKIAAMFAGEPINNTEGRSVLHTLLRAPTSSVGDRDKQNAVEATLTKMREFTQTAHAGGLGFTVHDVVNIGIGGSHLGPAMVCDALRDFRLNNIRTHFVSNVDASLLDNILRELRPENTLFIIASKSFTTSETLLNARSARAWFEQTSHGDMKVEDHFVAVSTATEHVQEFGIADRNIFPMWDWVGGRYSLWSAIGLPIALQCGSAAFESLLKGAGDMDQHFSHTAVPENLPAMLALVGIWHSNFLNSSSRAVIPYDDRLRLLPAYLQQLEMESNGKQVSVAGEVLEFDSSPIVWGGVGTDAQHAFFQLLHQGTIEVPVDFILCRKPHHQHDAHHRALVANCLAQAEALMCGTEDETDPARLMIGNHSSNLIVLDELSPNVLGSLLAMYEHRTMFQGAVWNINSFDQFGVELGKKLAQSIEAEITSGVIGPHDPSTAGLIERLTR